MYLRQQRYLTANSFRWVRRRAYTATATQVCQAPRPGWQQKRFLSTPIHHQRQRQPTRCLEGCHQRSSRPQ